MDKTERAMIGMGFSSKQIKKAQCNRCGRIRADILPSGTCAKCIGESIRFDPRKYY